MKTDKPFIEKLADEVETAAKTENIAELYKITKIFDGRFSNSETQMTDVNDITGIAEQRRRWMSLFETILSKEAPNNLAGIPVNDLRLGDQRRPTICCGTKESSQFHEARESTWS